MINENIPIAIAPTSLAQGYIKMFVLTEHKIFDKGSIKTENPNQHYILVGLGDEGPTPETLKEFCDYYSDIVSYEWLTQYLNDAKIEIKVQAKNIATLMKKGFSFNKAVSLLDIPFEQWDIICNEMEKRKAK